ncbi:hypothetical protein [Shimazuella kribbensis]|uniref:hypothetical protein n=1 Tax=Shimazuella kribbensis TaxID=139808 RepID=UPI000425985F|nr:hypothetical protein [Shimazuella kribbensis]
MKKFRGKKRYFRNIRRYVSDFKLKIDEDSWFDFWHIHLDFQGRGNHRLHIHKEYIKAHIALYDDLVYRLEKLKKPYQSWICIHLEDAGADAVYIHTPNPNNNYFPHCVNNINWNCKIPHSFKGLIDEDKFHVGYFKSVYEEIYFIQSKLNKISL